MENRRGGVQGLCSGKRATQSRGVQAVRSLCKMEGMHQWCCTSAHVQAWIGSAQPSCCSRRHRHRTSTGQLAVRSISARRVLHIRAPPGAHAPLQACAPMPQKGQRPPESKPLPSIRSCHVPSPRLIYCKHTAEPTWCSQAACSWACTVPFTHKQLSPPGACKPRTAAWRQGPLSVAWGR